MSSGGAVFQEQGQQTEPDPGGMFACIRARQGLVPLSNLAGTERPQFGVFPLSVVVWPQLSGGLKISVDEQYYRVNNVTGVMDFVEGSLDASEFTLRLCDPTASGGFVRVREKRAGGREWKHIPGETTLRLVEVGQGSEFIFLDDKNVPFSCKPEGPTGELRLLHKHGRHPYQPKWSRGPSFFLTDLGKLKHLLQENAYLRDALRLKRCLTIQRFRSRMETLVRKRLRSNALADRQFQDLQQQLVHANAQIERLTNDLHAAETNIKAVHSRGLTQAKRLQALTHSLKSVAEQGLLPVHVITELGLRAPSAGAVLAGENRSPNPVQAASVGRKHHVPVLTVSQDRVEIESLSRQMKRLGDGSESFSDGREQPENRNILQGVIAYLLR